MQMSLGWGPAEKGEFLASLNPPLRFPRRTVTLLSVSLVIARSGKLSLLKSAVSTLPGDLPTSIFVIAGGTILSWEIKLCVPPQLLNRIVTTEANFNMFFKGLVLFCFYI